MSSEAFFRFYHYYMKNIFPRQKIPFWQITSEYLLRLAKFVILNKIQVTACKGLGDCTKMKLFLKRVVFSEKCGIIHMKFTNANGVSKPFPVDLSPRAPDKSIEKTSGYVFARTTPTEITKGCDSDFTAGNLDRKNGRRAEGSRH
jgi:hypothetical protein